MIRRALSFIVRHGPPSDQDRWEESAGLNTFTLAACIAALVAGAEYLEPEARELALDFADYWNSRLEDWTAVHDTPLARQYGDTRAITCASRRLRRSPTGAPSIGSCPSGTRRWIRGCRRAHSSAWISCSWCASACAASMIR